MSTNTAKITLKNKGGTSSCPLCMDVDTNEMVQCDLCDLWYHYQCVHVDSTIANRDWKCDACNISTTTTNEAYKPLSLIRAVKMPALNPPTDIIEEARCGENRCKSINSSSRSTSSKALSKHRCALELQRIEEQRLMREKSDLEYVEKKYAEARALKTKSDEEFLKQKFEILLETATTDDDVDDDEDSPVGLMATRKESTENWLDKTNPFTASGYREGHTALNATQPISRAQSPQFKYPSRLNSQPPREEQLYPNNQHAWTEPVITTGLSHNQVAARHVLSKDLPCFSGKPEEWPLFISSFEGSTKTCGFTNDENLIRLQRCLKGKALDVVRCRLMLPSQVPSVISSLRTMYGRPELNINSILQNIRNEPNPKDGELETLIEFALSVENVVAVMEASHLETHLSNPTVLQELTDKLPASLKLNWALHKQTIPGANLQSFRTWLTSIGNAASDVTITSAFNTHSKSNKSDKRASKQNSFSRNMVNVHAAEASTTCVNNGSKAALKHVCKICASTCQDVESCKTFQESSHNEKWKAVKKYFLCRKCLKGHGKRACRKNAVCGLNGCSFKHHRLLHKTNTEEVPIVREPNHTTENVNTSNCLTHHLIDKSVMFRIVPVTIYGKNSAINTHAFLDDGSSVTLIEEQIMGRLGVHGEVQPLCLKWTGNTNRIENESQRVSFEISGINNQKSTFKIQAHTVKSLDLPTQSLNAPVLIEKHTYLKGTPVQSYKQAKPTILIGLDNWKLSIPLKCREGKETEPVATKTRLGWVVSGYYNNGDSIQSPTYYNYHICNCKNSDPTLLTLMKQFFSLEGVCGLKNQSTPVSKDDLRALTILESTTVFKDGHYQSGLLWKYDGIEMPSSYPMAKRRLECLEKRFSREPELAKAMSNKIAEYVEKKYARKLAKVELMVRHPRVWYLPIFPVYNQNKPGKVRIVWDAAAKADNISLNSCLLKGPDQLSSLFSILLRFREGEFAICGDIREMFHQVRIQPDDIHSQRFLWRDIPTQEPQAYVLNVMSFGATCSPSTAQFVMKKHALEFVNDHPRAVKSITDNHYVDDLLDCADTEEQALKLANDVTSIHAKAGFEIVGWISNSQRVLRALSKSGEQNKKDLNLGCESPIKKVLGMWWCISSDAFTFSLANNKPSKKFLNENLRPTKEKYYGFL